MSDATKRVLLVVDEDYGPRLQSLARSSPVWIVDTEANRKAVVEVRQLAAESGSDAAVTTFKYLRDDSAPATCLKILPVVDLHHGAYSGGYSVLEVIGAGLSEDLRVAIEALGFSEFEPTADGFVASRHSP